MHLNNNGRIEYFIYHNYIFIFTYLIFQDTVFHIIFSYCFVHLDIFKESIKLCIQRFQLAFNE